MGALGDFASFIRDKAGDAVDAVEDTASAAVNAVEDTASAAHGAAAEFVRAVTSGNIGQDGRDGAAAVKHGARAALDAVQEAAAAAGEAITEAGQAAGAAIAERYRAERQNYRDFEAARSTRDADSRRAVWDAGLEVATETGIVSQETADDLRTANMPLRAVPATAMNAGVRAFNAGEQAVVDAGLEAATEHGVVSEDTMAAVRHGVDLGQGLRLSAAKLVGGVAAVAIDPLGVGDDIEHAMRAASASVGGGAEGALEAANVFNPATQAAVATDQAIAAVGRGDYEAVGEYIGDAAAAVLGVVGIAAGGAAFVEARLGAAAGGAVEAAGVVEMNAARQAAVVSTEATQTGALTPTPVSSTTAAEASPVAVAVETNVANEASVAATVPADTAEAATVTEGAQVATPESAEAAAASEAVEGSTAAESGAAGASAQMPEGYFDEAISRVDQGEFGPAGSGWHHGRGIAVNVDEPLAVGEPGISPQEALDRALDLGERQILDPMTNQATKGAAVEVPIIPRDPLPPTSLAENPSALVSRPSLEGVAEWDEMVAEIEQRVCPRLTGKSAPEIKNILNAAIREEIKNPTTQAGRIVKETLESQLGKPASESFSSQGTIFRWDKPGKPPTK